MTSEKVAQKLAQLQSSDDQARREAAFWLSGQDIQESCMPLITALQDRSWPVRRNAAVALGSLGNPDAVEPLLVALTDSTLRVKRAAIQSLGMLGDVRALSGLMFLHRHLLLGSDAMEAIMRIGAPALLYCCQQMQDESSACRYIAQQTAHQMIRFDAGPLLIETLRAENWSAQQRWLVLESVRKIQFSFSWLENSNLNHFSRIFNVSSWCWQILSDPKRVELHPGSQQVWDYITLGRASERDDATERDILLRAAGGTTPHDTGQTLLRASDKNAEVPK